MPNIMVTLSAQRRSDQDDVEGACRGGEGPIFNIGIVQILCHHFRGGGGFCQSMTIDDSSQGDGGRGFGINDKSEVLMDRR